MKNIFYLLLCLGVTSCGVKGDPLPPYKKPYIGRGKPTYKRAMKDFSYKNVPELKEKEEEDEETEEDE